MSQQGRRIMARLAAPIGSRLALWARAGCGITKARATTPPHLGGFCYALYIIVPIDGRLHRRHRTACHAMPSRDIAAGRMMRGMRLIIAMCACRIALAARNYGVRTRFMIAFWCWVIMTRQLWPGAAVRFFCICKIIRASRHAAVWRWTARLCGGW